MTRRKAVPLVTPLVTWILIADGRQAQVYTRGKMEKYVPLADHSRRTPLTEIMAHEVLPVAGMSWKAESPEQYQAGRNATGMVFESVGGARHMSEPRVDIHEEIRQRFAGTIAEGLNRALNRKRFDRLVLVASPQMLGEIRKNLDKKVQARVMAEMPKDLTHYEGEELLEHLNHLARGD